MDNVGLQAAFYVNRDLQPKILGYFSNYLFVASLSGQSGSFISWLGVKMPGAV
jgi:hypothetical protein